MAGASWRCLRGVCQAEGQPGQRLQDTKMLGASKDQQGAWVAGVECSDGVEGMKAWFCGFSREQEKGHLAGSVEGACDS